MKQIFRKVDQKYLESFGIRWTDRVRNIKVTHRVKEARNILNTIKRRKANCVSHILCRNCLLKHVIQRNTERRMGVTGKRGRMRKQLLDDYEARGCRKLKKKSKY